MDSERFDAMTRRLGSRRVALGGFAGGIVAVTAWLALDSMEARKRRKKKRRKKKNKVQSPPPDQASPPPTCTDGVKNGDETDVDCGGSCPRCTNGKACTSRDDCLGGLCVGNLCQECTSTAQCNNGQDAPCACESAANGVDVCTTSTSVGDVDECADCPTDSLCIEITGGFRCLLPCGAE
jgi:hypothetical protein